MKNLLYKEFILSVHPLTYFFMALMALVCLSPGLPSFVPLLYFGACYTFLFIGMNKTTTTNDLLYTCTLPIQRKDVVTARICSTSVLQLFETILILPLLAVSKFGFINNMPETSYSEVTKSIVTIGIEQGIFLVGVYLLCYVVFDLVYLPWFYKTGKSIIANMLVGIIALMAAGAILTIVPYFIVPLREAITIGGEHANYFVQIGFLLFAIAVWVGSKFLIRHMCVKNLVKLDF